MQMVKEAPSKGIYLQMGRLRTLRRSREGRGGGMATWDEVRSGGVEGDDGLEGGGVN